MRAVITVSALVVLGFSLSGCAVAEVGGAVVGVAGSVVSTTVDVAGDAVGAVTGGDADDDKKK